MEYNYIFCNDAFKSLNGKIADKARGVLDAKMRLDKEVIGDIRAIYLNQYYFRTDVIVDEYLKTLSQEEVQWIKENNYYVEDYIEFEDFCLEQCIRSCQLEDEEFWELVDDSMELDLERILESQSILIIMSMSSKINVEISQLINDFKYNIETMFNYSNYLTINLIK